MVVYIAIIESKDSERSAIWIDGYIPSSEKIEPKLKKMGVYSKISYTELGWTELDYMIRDFLSKQRAIFHKKASEKGKAELHLCDLFYSKALPFGELPEVFKKITPFYEEIINDKDNNYRQLIVTYEPQLCSVGKQCTMNLIKELEFELKSPENYKNFKRFKESCQEILDHIAEAYEAPCIIASGRLKNLGFLAECDQS